jgi:acyl carrier protein
VQNFPTAQELRELVASTLEVDPTQITADADLWADLGADSLALANLLAALEERLQLRLPPERFSDVETVHDLYTILRETTDSAWARKS